MYNYKYYTSGNKVVATSTFAGRPVRGIAKCDPEDIFSLENGKKLATARCNNKIAVKRVKSAKKKLEKAVAALEAAKKQEEFMADYYLESVAKLGASTEELNKILKEL